ncbi:MAG: 3-deoxy-7-phosphoheptulonate synthase, partial [Proteobacteria bacterium]
MVNKVINKTHHVNVEYAGRTIHFGNGSVVVMAGPCSIESRDVFLETAKAVKAAGSCFLRGGIYKMRTAPGSFQGLGPSAFGFVNEVKKEVGLPLVSE